MLPSGTNVRSVLEAADMAGVPKWEYEPEGNLIRVASVYDGDTLTGVCLLGGQLRAIKIRLLGIDCPEMRGRGIAEKNAAIAVRDVVRSLCVDQVCQVAPHGSDKYGRLIAEVFLPFGRDLSAALLTNGLGKPYGGKAREAFAPGEIEEILSISARLAQESLSRVSPFRLKGSHRISQGIICPAILWIAKTTSQLLPQLVSGE